jgi:succinoglycan biosynthesis transport protein ExoP
MELRQYLKILKRRKWVILITALATVAVFALGTFRQQPVYSTAVTVRVAQASSGSIQYVDYMYAERLMNTYIEILRSSAFLDEVIRKLGLAVATDDLARQIQAEVVPNTELLRIHAADHNPARARDIANALGALLVERSRDLYFGGTKSAREVLQERLDAVEDDLERDRAELQALISASAAENAGIDALETRIRSGEEVYADLLSQFEQARVAEAAGGSSVAIVAPAAVPAAPAGRDGPQLTYLATATVRVSQPYRTTAGYAEYAHVERLMNTYAELLKSEPILEEVIQRLDLPELPSALLREVEVEVLPDTELLTLKVADRSPERASDIANALAGLLVEQVQALYSGDAQSARAALQQQLGVIETNLEQDRAALQDLLDGSAQENARMDALETKIRAEEEAYASLLRQYEDAGVAEATRESSATIVAPAIEPDSPSKPRKKLNMVLGTLVGAVAGVGLAFLFEYLDPALHSADDLEAATSTPVLGLIPRVAVRGASSDAILINKDGQSPAAEAFRILRGNLLSVASTKSLKTLMVTSAEPAAGKSMVLANLAASMADAGLRVVAVDGDLRRPSQHVMFDLPNDVGLSDVLLDLGQAETALQETETPGLRVLTSGPIPPNPAELVGLPALRELITQLAKEADVVLLDSPPMLSAADTATLSRTVDGVLIVAAQDQTTGRGIQRTLQQLAMVRAETIGIAFNRTTDRDADDYYYHYRDNGASLDARSLLRSLLGRS